MSRIPIERTIIWGYWLAFFVLVTIGIFTYHNSKELESSDYAMAHTGQMLHNLSEIQNICLEMESAARGYTLLPQPVFRTTVLNGEPLVLGYVMELNSLIGDNADQKVNAMELEKRITRFSLIQRTLVKVREIQGFDAAVAYLASVEAPRVTRELIQQIRTIEEHEQKLLTDRKKMREELISSFNWLYISLLSSVFIALIIVYSNIIATLRKARNA